MSSRPRPLFPWLRTIAPKLTCATARECVPLKKSTLPERGRTTQKRRAPRQEHAGLICGIAGLDASAHVRLLARAVKLNPLSQESELESAIISRRGKIAVGMRSGFLPHRARSVRACRRPLGHYPGPQPRFWMRL